MKTWTDGNFMALDLETTSADPQTAEIVEVGVAWFGGGRCLKTDGQLCHPGVPIPPEATAIHRITDADVLGKPPASLVLSVWLSALHIQDAIVGFNCSHFDVPIVQRVLRRQGVFTSFPVVDVYAFIDWHHRDWRSRKLTAVAAHYGVDLPQAHSASADARAAGEILLHLVAQGLVPQDLEAAVARSGELRQALDEERARWSHWLYADRQTGALRLGCGKHLGWLVTEADPHYFASALNEITDLPEAVREVFQQHAPARPTNWQRLAEERGAESAALRGELEATRTALEALRTRKRQIAERCESTRLELVGLRDALGVPELAPHEHALQIAERGAVALAGDRAHA